MPLKISSPNRAEPPRQLGLHSPARTIFISIPRRTGSAIPKVRRSPSIFSDSCVAAQDRRRASRGWDDVVAVVEKDGWERDERSGSGRPGTDGAVVMMLVARLVDCDEDGIRRRDYSEISSAAARTRETARTYHAEARIVRC